MFKSIVITLYRCAAVIVFFLFSGHKITSLMKNNEKHTNSISDIPNGTKSRSKKNVITTLRRPSEANNQVI